MATMWIEHDGQWQAITLPAVMELKANGPAPLRGVVATAPIVAPIPGATQTWLLIAPVIGAVVEPVFVNGEQILAGACRLSDRDAIRVGRGATMFFSTSQSPVVTAFSGAKPLKCVRCSELIQPGTPAVRCPSCGIWHHQNEERACFDYADRCGGCNVQSTSLDEDSAWSPREV
jgi:hypothetical protein